MRTRVVPTRFVPDWDEKIAPPRNDLFNDVQSCHDNGYPQPPLLRNRDTLEHENLHKVHIRLDQLLLTPSEY